MSDRQRTPAERAGATHLDTSATNPAMAGGRESLNRTIDSVADVDDSDLAQQVVRRRRTRRSGKPWFQAGVISCVVGVALIAAAFVSESDITPATGLVSRSFLSTPIASSRRVPDFTVEPIAARNLGAELAGVFANAPADSCVQIADAGSPVAARNEAQPLIPASNQKVVTAGAALEIIGAETLLQTRFLTDGKPTDGSTVKGNLYMVGGADPLLTTNSHAGQARFRDQPRTDLDAVADKLVATGIRHITGSVVGDGSRFDDLTKVESWPDRYFTQGQVGRLSALVVNDSVTSTGAQALDPPLHAATVLSALLRDRGVVIDTEATAGTAPPGAAVLLEIPSLPLKDIVAQMLRFSDNTTAEILFKEIGRLSGTGGSTVGGAQAVTKWATSSALPLEGVQIVDGSGLSHDNRITCAFLSSVLAAGNSDGPLAAGLATPGNPGTLKDRFPKAPLHDAVRAKTGSLNGVTSLSGWLQTEHNVPVDFSIIINPQGRGVSSSDMEFQTAVLNATMSYPNAPDPATLGPLEPRTVE